jgi:hypothetical protein
MSLTISTDVFCDQCSDWTYGPTGPRTNKKLAPAMAKRAGWKITSRKHLCPRCAHEHQPRKDQPHE